jgi:CheY-like chemotaxis protein
MATILVCDDEDVLRALIRATLDRTHTVVEARDGDEAVARAQDLRPDLVVLDVMMPGRSGIDVLAALRADARTAAIPVLMLTARTQASDRDAAASGGADRYLPKPFSPAVLAKTVDELLPA